ncbi:FlhC family transcriptional regulator [Burkholderia multivorans]|uniref:FlhC family transcriptional regulator n=1 Tax=Burkholderia multivorans TaxID=87883 RepID=UPI001C22D208|nr:FlhC family transcriptional regulator [Burkholderia multivorans]MBU9211617.1 flagellar transcriptional regulator FlhC [Burkholderia multivorans]
MVELAELQKLRLAHALIQAGLRLSIVRGMTDIGTRTLRQWWKDVHGVKPSNGKLPESVLSFIKDKDSAARLSAFAALHRRLHGSELTPESLLTTWREYQRLCGPVDINAAYFAVRDVRAWIVSLSRCRVCNATFIYDAGSRHTDRCPFCDTRVLAD